MPDFLSDLLYPPAAVVPGPGKLSHMVAALRNRRSPEMRAQAASDTSALLDRLASAKSSALDTLAGWKRDLMGPQPVPQGVQDAVAEQVLHAPQRVSAGAPPETPQPHQPAPLYDRLLGALGLQRQTQMLQPMSPEQSVQAQLADPNVSQVHLEPSGPDEELMNTLGVGK